MKKFLTALLIIILILTAGIYLFIPAKIQINRTVTIPATPSATFRILSDNSTWKNWWPGSDNKSTLTNEKNQFAYKGYSYIINQKFFNTLGILISGSDDVKINSSLIILSILKDSVAVEWQAIVIPSKNPVTRIQDYRKAMEIENNMKEVLSHIQSFLGNEKNIYGMNIQRTVVKDTLLMSTKFTSNQNPTTEEIYSSINKIREYISRHGASESNYPMLNVSLIDSNRFQTMVAIPVNQVLKDNSDIYVRRMVRGYILEGEVKGGAYTARQALKQLENYVNDHSMNSPAIPFESLLTDRSSEPDTTKWITKLYYPVL